MYVMYKLLQQARQEALEQMQACIDDDVTPTDIPTAKLYSNTAHLINAIMHSIDTFYDMCEGATRSGRSK